MKIHEASLRYDPESLCVKDDVGANYAQSVEEEDGPFFAAAPKMARALLALGRFGKGIPEEWHTHECWDNETQVECMPSCSAARSALRGAGVL